MTALEPPRAGRAALIALAAVLLAAPPGYAQSTSRPSVIAVLPLSAQDGSTEIYSKPVADALVRQLRRDLAAAANIEIEALSTSGAVPARVDLLIDGRIVSRSSRRIMLEAQIRDPESGSRLAVVASAPGPLTHIDRLAAELGRRLAAELARALERTGPPARGPILMPETVVVAEAAGDVEAVEAGPAASSGHGRRAAGNAAGSARDRPRAPDDRPRIVVFQAAGTAAHGTIPVGDVATGVGYGLVDALGFRPVASATRGIVAPSTAVHIMRRARARYGLMLDVVAIEFSWYGVLAARGEIRAVVIDAAGDAIYDRVHRTDTLVGSRGDRHAALVRFVLSQARDILRPQLALALSHK